MRKKIELILFLALLSLSLKYLFAVAGPAPAEIIVRPKEEYKGVGLKDPFKNIFQKAPIIKEKLPEPELPLPELKVQGIIEGGRFNQAVVNNKVVKEGDTLEGVTITEISKVGITVLFNKKTHTLSSPAVNMLEEAAKKSEGGQNEK